MTGGAAGVDAVAEFSVVTTNYSAEYGRTSGGVINAITRSGTNQFHGDVYEFLRNSALDAPNYFDANGVAPPFRRNQFGVSGGAPIIKNKTFVFGNYEGLRQSLGTTFKDIVPSAAARNGQILNNPEWGSLHDWRAVASGIVQLHELQRGLSAWTPRSCRSWRCGICPHRPAPSWSGRYWKLHVCSPTGHVGKFLHHPRGPQVLGFRQPVRHFPVGSRAGHIA